MPAPPATVTPWPDLAALRPDAAVAARYYQQGWWRTETLWDDICRHAARTPEKPAVIDASADCGARPTQVSYRDLRAHAERMAGGLVALGVGPGDPVACLLPNRWETAAFLLACFRVGAVVVGVVPTDREREMETALASSRAVLCVVPEEYAGVRHAELLTRLAPGLPALRHRIVLAARPSQGAEPDSGVTDFSAYFLRQPHPAPAAPPPGPDQPCTVQFTSGTTGRRKSVLHTQNTLFAGAGLHDPATAPTSAETIAALVPLTRHAGLMCALWAPLSTGGTTVLHPTTRPGPILDTCASTGVTSVIGAAWHWAELVAEQRRAPRPLARLRSAFSVGAAVPPAVITGVPETFGVPVHTTWGMTEIGLAARAREHDPPAEKPLRVYPLPGVQLRLRAADEDPSMTRALVRGPSVCLASWASGAGTMAFAARGAPPPRTRTSQTSQPSRPDHSLGGGDGGDGGAATESGWFDTGDLLRRYASGALEIRGRLADRVRNGSRMVLAVEIEAAVLAHPDIDEAAVASFVDAHGIERAGLVVTAARQRPTLSGMRDWLSQSGFSDYQLPARLEFLPTLPRNAMGKVLRAELRSWLATQPPPGGSHR